MNRIELVYEQILNIYTRKIESRELMAGDELDPELEISEKYAVARGTVRKAMAELEHMGYILPSRRGSRRVVADISGREAAERPAERARRIALLIPSQKEYLSSMAEEMAFRVCRIGWELEVFVNSSERTEWNIVSSLVERQFDGAAIMPHYPKTGLHVRAFSRLQAAGVPYVLLCKPARNLVCDAVYADDYVASYEMTRILWKERCREVVHVTDSDMNSVVRKDRLEGYYDGLNENRQKLPRIFDFRTQEGRDEFERYALAANYKFGVNFYSNILFEQAKGALERLGKKKGRDYEAIGFDEQNFEGEKGIDLVCVPKEALIRRTLDVLRERLQSGPRDYVRHEIFNVQFKKSR